MASGSFRGIFLGLGFLYGGGLDDVPLDSESFDSGFLELLGGWIFAGTSVGGVGGGLCRCEGGRLLSSCFTHRSRHDCHG